MTFPNFSVIFFHFNAFFLKIVYLSIAISHRLISSAKHLYPLCHFFLSLRPRATHAHKRALTIILVPLCRGQHGVSSRFRRSFIGVLSLNFYDGFIGALFFRYRAVIGPFTGQYRGKWCLPFYDGHPACVLIYPFLPSICPLQSLRKTKNI